MNPIVCDDTTTTTTNTDVNNPLANTDTASEPAARRRKRQAVRSQGPPGVCQDCKVPGAIDTENRFLFFYMSLSESVRMRVGHQIDDLVVDCSFRGRDCTDVANFYKISSATFGNCYTFNSMFSATDKYAGSRKSSLPGANLGLNLVVKLEQDQYMINGTTQSAGAR